MRVVVPRHALLPLRAMVDAGLDHRASRLTLTVVTKANQERTTSRTAADPVPAHLQVAGSRIAELAAARGGKVDWTLRLRRIDEAVVGDHWQVTGVERGVEWARTVEITADLTFTGKVMRLYAAVDVEVTR